MSIAATEPAVGVQLRPLEVLFHSREGSAIADYVNPDEEYTEKRKQKVECPECKKDVTVEVTVSVEVSRYDVGRMDGIFEALHRRGIDTGRPMWLHIDPISQMVTARQEPWEG